MRLVWNGIRDVKDKIDFRTCFRHDVLIRFNSQKKKMIHRNDVTSLYMCLTRIREQVPLVSANKLRITTIANVNCQYLTTKIYLCLFIKNRWYSNL